MPKITHYETFDVRFPTNLTGDGTDAMNLEVDYSAAYLKLFTDGPLTGYGMTFTIGRGNDIVCHAIREVAKRVVGKDLESLFDDMGNTWNILTSDPQLRWIGPEKGVIHLATAAVDNAIWDLYAKSRKKPLWKLIVDMSPEELVKSTTFKYISDVLTPQEALAMLQAKASGKSAREQTAREAGYPAYVTSAGWLRYDDEKVARLIREAIKAGFTHFKMKVGSSLADDTRRAKLIRAIIDDPASFPPGYVHPDPASLVGKNAGPTGCVLMMDANQVGKPEKLFAPKPQLTTTPVDSAVFHRFRPALALYRPASCASESQVWDVPEAIEYVSHLSEAKPWFIEEPTAPDDFLGHAAIRAGLAPLGIGVATGEHAHNRVAFKQLLQAGAVDVVQPDACRLGGVSEVLAVLLLASKFGVLACFHAGGVVLCEHTIHLSLIDYIAITGSMERNVLEYAEHLHEHFVHPCQLDTRGRYRVPSHADEGYSTEMHDSSIAEFGFPHGSYWRSAGMNE
ncbi:hypothetical protein FRC08_010231 [Ceratobasidium sp. 394]|nr:hypothetical protein FRC08_010231 [Ceratobasidium sp. 394]